MVLTLLLSARRVAPLATNFRRAAIRSPAQIKQQEINIGPRPLPSSVRVENES